MSINPPKRSSLRDCDHGLRRQLLVQSLLMEIFQGSIQAGDHLVTQELATRFGVSHTPIREALITLAGIGFVEIVPNRGAIVRQVTPKEVKEVCQVRRVLECEATRLASGKIDRPTLEALSVELRKVSLAQDPGPEWVVKAQQLDSQLHDSIAASCDNAFLKHELNRLKILFRTFRGLSWEYDQANNDFARLAIEAKEHLAIVDALLIDDRVEAVRAMSRHIRSGIKYWGRAVGNRRPAKETTTKRSAKRSRR
jgi:DNA-binding GntR family transcriptional regulator